MSIANDGIVSVNHGATNQELNLLEREFGFALPCEYRGILERANGFSLKNGLHFYSTSDVIERNETFEVKNYAPGYVAIGDDSGGRVFLIATDKPEVYLVDVGSMDPDDFECVSASLIAWEQDGFPF